MSIKPLFGIIPGWHIPSDVEWGVVKPEKIDMKGSIMTDEYDKEIDEFIEEFIEEFPANFDLTAESQTNSIN